MNESVNAVRRHWAPSSPSLPPLPALDDGGLILQLIDESVDAVDRHAGRARGRVLHAHHHVAGLGVHAQRLHGHGVEGLLLGLQMKL